MNKIGLGLAVLCSGIILTACGGGKSSSVAPAPAAPPSVFTPGGTVGTSSSATASGALGAFTSNGSRFLTSPAPATSGAADLLKLPNSGTTVGKTAIATSLTYFGAPAAISGTAVDPANDIGVAFNYYISKISLFQLSTAKEIATYDTKTTTTQFFSGASVTIAGVIMNSANKTIVLATADGLQIVSYATPTAPALVRAIPSLNINATTGVEIMENIALDAKLPSGPMIITGGGTYNATKLANNPAMVLVDANTGTVYRPDAATAALFTISLYIDAAAVDTTYHVAVLADEGTGTTFVDLNKLTLNAAAGTYTLPITAVSKIITYTKMDNLALESTNHLLLMGQGCGGTSAVVAQLNAPSIGLGFAKQVTLTMPTGNDNLGISTTFWNTCDPHSAGAYFTDPTTLVQPNTSKALWLSGDGHVADINLLNVLNGVLSQGVAYNPMATTPQDIAYYKIP